MPGVAARMRRAASTPSIPRHPHVHQDDVGPGELDLANRRLPVGGFPHDLEPVQARQQGAQPAADDGVVVGQHDAKCVHPLIMAAGGSR